MSRVTPRRAAAVAAALAIVLLVAWVVHDLAKVAPRRSGVNYIDSAGVIQNLTRGSEICQDEPIPADTGGAALQLATSGGRPPDVVATLRDGARVVARGRLRHGWVPGLTIVPLRPTVRRSFDGTLCVRNAGHGSPLLISGQPYPSDSGARADGQPTATRVHIQWFRPGEESYLELAPTVLARVPRAKATWLGDWIGVALPLMALGLLAGTAYVAVRPCD